MLVALGILLLIATAASLHFGAVAIPWSVWIAPLTGQSGQEAELTGATWVFWQLRAPRVVLALLVGAALSVAGALMQGMFRNPLADPGLVGVSSGAALGAVLMIVLGGQLGLPFGIASSFLLPVAALVGAWGVTFVILMLGSTRGVTSVATLLLAGIAINAFVGAVIGLCTFLADDAQLRSLNFWMLGSLGAASWTIVAATLPFCVILLVAAPWCARPLNAMTLGEAEAGHLGFHPERVKRWIIFLTAVGVGGCVAQTGIIGFIGLVIPHLIRLSIGPDHRWLLPASAVLGAALLAGADTLARVIVAPAEMPIGILTSAVGAPFFLLLLWRQRGKPGFQ